MVGPIPNATTVTPLQVAEEEIEMRIHDIPVDVIVTPQVALERRSQVPRLSGITWDRLPEEKIAAIPVVDQMRRVQKHGTREGDDR